MNGRFSKIFLVFLLVLVGLFLIYPTVNAAQDVTIQPTYKTGPFAGQTPSGGLEPNSEINLNIVFTGDTNACSGSLGYQLFRTLAHAKGGNLNDVEYLANDSGGSATFSYKFNSGPSGQRNVYWAIFYCWSSPVPGVALGTARLWQSYKFDQTTAGAPCSFSAPAWGQTDGKVGSTVPLSVKGTTAGCKGVSFSFEIWRGGKDLGNRLETTVASSFPASGNLPLTATANWKIASNQKYAFKIRLAEGGCARTTGDVCLWSGDLSSSGGGGGGDTAGGSSTAGGEKECKGGGLVPCGRLCDDPTTPEDETRPCTTCDIFALASRVVNFVLFTLVPAIAVLSYLIAGFMILLGGARPGLIAKGKSWFWDTTIGLFIIFGAWMITNTVLKSIAGDSDVSNSWFRIECTGILQQLPTSSPTPTPSLTPTPTPIPTPTPSGSETPTPTPSSTGTVSPTPTLTPSPLACMFNSVDYAKVDLCQGQKRPGGCGTSLCSQYLPSISKYANGAATVAVLKTFMVVESDCNIGAGTGSSYGLMQLQPSTANMFKNRCGVGVFKNITSSWLTSPANAEKSICIGAEFIKALAAGTCGSQPRNIYAGYNAGPGNCAASSDCASDKSCDGGTMKKWECPYDNLQHTVCNTGMYQTKQGATYVNYCLNNLGF